MDGDGWRHVERHSNQLLNTLRDPRVCRNENIGDSRIGNDDKLAWIRTSSSSPHGQTFKEEEEKCEEEELSLLIRDLQSERSVLISSLDQASISSASHFDQISSSSPSIEACQQLSSKATTWQQEQPQNASTSCSDFNGQPPSQCEYDPLSALPTTSSSSFAADNFANDDGLLQSHQILPLIVFRANHRLKQIDLELSKLQQFQQLQERESRQRQMGKMMQSIATATTPNDKPKLLPGQYHIPPPAEVNSQHRSEPQNSMFQFISMMNGDQKATTERLLTLCQSKETCLQLSCMGIMPFIVQIIHDPNCAISRTPRDIRVKAGTILHHLVSSHPEDKRTRREMSILRLLEEVRAYSDAIINNRHHDVTKSDESEECPPIPVLVQLMKKSYEEEFRHSICLLGGLQAVAELLQCNFGKYDHTNSPYHSFIRINSAKILVNLTFGDGTNKSLLSSSQSFLETLAHLINSSNEEVRMNVASLIRNLSWKTDIASRENLKNAKMIGPLLRSAMIAKSEMSLKAMLSALWNISAHWIDNKQEICGTEGALEFLVSHLAQKRPFSTTSVVELSGGILRNICSVIADREDYRAVLRQNHCLEVLVSHLRAPSIEWVINATGILWNLSARCVQDQQKLWDLGAVSLLKGLMNNKDARIAANSAHAYRKLMNAQTAGNGVGSARAQSMPRRWKNGRNVTANVSLEDQGRIENDNFSSFRKITSVPNSPLISSRSNRSAVESGSMSDRHRRPSNNNSDQRREQVTLLMSETRREIKESSFSSSAVSKPQNIASPPLSPDSVSEEDEEHSYHLTANSKFIYPVQVQVQEDNTSFGGYELNMTQQPYFQSIPKRVDPPRYSPYQAPFQNNNLNLQWQFKPGDQIQIDDEVETRDEFIDYGANDARRTYAMNELEVDTEDTVRQFNTEGTPLFSTATSIYDLRSGSISRRPTLSKNASKHSDVAGLVAKHVSINQVNINSMIVSRSSSPGNLSEVDLEFNDENADKQSEYSEFSRRGISEVVSPSDIPASPSLMPRSSSNNRNKRRLLPIPPVSKKSEETKIVQPVRIRDRDLSEDEQNILEDCINSGMTMKLSSTSQTQSQEVSGTADNEVNGRLSQPHFTSLANPLAKSLPINDLISDDMFVPDSTRVFASEGVSAATSLSSLTMSGFSERPKSRPKLLPKLPFPEEAEEVTPDSNGSFQFQAPPPPPAQFSQKSENPSSPKILAPRSFWIDASQPVENQIENISAFIEKKSIASSPLSPSGGSTPYKSSGDYFQFNQSNQLGFANSPQSPSRGPPIPVRASSMANNNNMKCIESEPQSQAQAPPPPPPLIFHHKTPSPLQQTSQKNFSNEDMKKATTPPPPPPPLDVNLLNSPKRSPLRKVPEKLIVNALEENDSRPPMPTSEPPPLSPEAQELICKLDQDLLADCIYSALPKKSKEKNKPEEKAKTSPESEMNDEDLLADCIYAALPGKSAKSKKPHKKTGDTTASARKMQIQMSIKEMSAGMSSSQSVGFVSSKNNSPEGVKRSRTFEETGLEEKEMKTYSLPRDHLRLSLIRKAMPASEENIAIKTSEKSANQSSENVQPPRSVTPKLADVTPPGHLNSPSIRHMDSPMSSSHTLTDNAITPNALVEDATETREASSPDIFEGLNEADSSLASRFTSEASGEEDGSARSTPLARPKIVKPVRVPSTGLKKAFNGDLPPGGKPHKNGNVRNGRTSTAIPLPTSNIAIRSVSTQPQGQFFPVANRPMNGRAESVPVVQTSAIIDHSQNNFSTKLTKQGTFIKPSQTALLPIIFPDTDISKNAAMRKRFASVTRAPRESSSSAESQRITKAASPNPRSSRSLSARPPEKSVSGVDLSLPQPTKPKRKPVVSKIAALLKTDKSKGKQEKGKSGALKTAESTPVEPFFSSWRKTSVSAPAPPQIKSPTLSEKFTPRTLVTVPLRMNATLPKNMAAQSIMLNNKNLNANLTEKSKAQSKGSLTVTSV